MDAKEKVIYLFLKEWYLNLECNQCPECFARKKEDAENFAACVAPYIGEYELVYTRNERGKELLLEGRVKSLEHAGAQSATHKVVRKA